MIKFSAFCAFLLFFFSSNLAQDQPKEHSYSGTMVLSLDAMASSSKTDYITSKAGVGVKAMAEYFFLTSTKSNFGFRLSGSLFNLKGKDETKDLTEFKTNMYAIGAGVSYSYSIEDRFFPYIYGGPSFLIFRPKDQFDNPAPNSEIKAYDENVFTLDGEVGFRLTLQDNINLNAGIAYHLAPTDYLDDIAIGKKDDGYLTAFLGISFSFFGNKDSDGDGIPNDKDKCPDEPEDFDGFQDDDGCPDFDNDNDGILDVNDKCPNEPEDIDGFEDSDGCPDIDNDKDGILDINDKCPNSPEDYDGFQDEDGCPDVDNDGDGILDVNDKCPNAAEDFDGFEDSDGCPDVDNDRDGILDVNDKCPDEPEDFDGFQDEDGCPDLDNDGDGILDKDDACPDQPETVNGYMDNDGCPDVAPADKNKNNTSKLPTLVTPPVVKTPDIKKDIKPNVKKEDKPVEKEPIPNLSNEFMLYGVLTFEDEKAEIKSSAFKELDRIAEIIKKYPNTKWRIEGHMDNQGSEYYIKTLSTNRAKAVLSYFVSKGLQYSQFEAVGLGDKYPIESNDKPFGRSKNRRIVIKRIK